MAAFRSALLGGTAAALLWAAPAQGAVTIGSDLSPSPINAGTCTVPNCTATNLSIGGQTTQSPIDGVVVRWRVFAANFAANGTEVALRVLRPSIGDAFRGMNTGPSELLPNAASVTLFTFETRQPLVSGDLVALDVGNPNNNLIINTGAQTGTTFARWVPPLPDDSAQPPSALFSDTGETTFNADVEADADNDGFGDETQDACPADPALQDAPCDRVAPDTTITKGPKAKTKKKTATFEFTGTDARAVAGFECSLDGAAFASCASPHTEEVKKGKHTLEVRATDEAGNRDASAATYSWKVKKKRKKK